MYYYQPRINTQYTMKMIKFRASPLSYLHPFPLDEYLTLFSPHPLMFYPYSTSPLSETMLTLCNDWPLASPNLWTNGSIRLHLRIRLPAAPTHTHKIFQTHRHINTKANRKRTHTNHINGHTRPTNIKNYRTRHHLLWQVYKTILP